MQRLLSSLRSPLLAATGVFTIVAAIAFFASGMLGASADTGGPGGANYSWFDSNDPDPKVDFDWVDPLAPGASVLGGDDNFATLDIPFAFSFYGQDYSQVDVSSNGFLSFDVGNECNENYNSFDDDKGQTIPANGNCSNSDWGGNPLIAGWFDDLDPGECGVVVVNTVGDAPDRIFVAEYSDVCHNDCDGCAAGEGVTFQILLFEGSNDIKMQYKDTHFADSPPDLSEENNGGTATVGINKDGGIGLQYSANQPKLTDNLAVLFTTDGLPTPTPVPTPEPTPPTKGDADCDGDADSVDALKILQNNAGIPYTQNEPCTDIGDPIE